MRPVTRDDRGAVLVFVALLLVVLFGVGALVIDVGALYAERRELQNGADAAALAVAADCAEGDCLDEATTANTYADRNANDGAANIDEVCGFGPGLTTCPTPPAATSGVSGWVRVSTSTDNPANSNPDEVRFLLAPVLDVANVGNTVHASAVAAWGPTGGATTIPFTFSVCEFENFGGSLDGLTFPSGQHYVYAHKTDPDTPRDCMFNPSSGLRVPGGFGWLESTDCEVTISVGDWVDSDTGNNLPGGCDPHEWLNAEVLIPLYDECARNGDKCVGGSGGEFHIVAFAGFKVLGYKVGNQSEGMPGNGKCPETSGNSGRCFYGEFTRVTTTGAIGGGTNYGASVVQMIG